MNGVLHPSSQRQLLTLKNAAVHPSFRFHLIFYRLPERRDKPNSTAMTSSSRAGADNSVSARPTDTNLGLSPPRGGRLEGGPDDGGPDDVEKQNDGRRHEQAHDAATASHGRVPGEAPERKTSAFQALGWLDRFLAVWVLLAMVAGVLLGNFVPEVGPALQRGRFVGVSVPIGRYLPTYLPTYPFVGNMDTSTTSPSPVPASACRSLRLAFGISRFRP